jgi:ATP-dependent DNA ligase
MTKSVFYRSMHPKTEISPTRAAIERTLRAGWVGQAKINGHRAQIHVHASPDHKTLVYNRQGWLHKSQMPPSMIAELRRILPLHHGWTVIDSEWVKPKKKLYLFDLIKLNGKLLRHLSYSQRYALLPKDYLSPHVQTLPLLRSPDHCLELLTTPDSMIEGLVFKSPVARGFADTSIVRCRKAKIHQKLS